MPHPGEYPPPKHVHRDLRLALEHGADGSNRGWMPVVPEILTPWGSLHAGAIAVLIDVVAAGLSLRAVAPDWIATADLTLYLTENRPSTPGAEIEARGHLLRRGRTRAVCAVDVIDATGAMLGAATLSFAVLPHRNGNLVANAGQRPPERTSLAIDGSGLTAPWSDYLGISVAGTTDGSAEVPLSDHVLNSFGSLQGGVLAALASASAESAVAATHGAPGETVALQVTYLAGVRGGPARATAEVVASERNRCCTRVGVIDDDNGRLCAIASIGVPTSTRT